jgi:hypothetical protein
MQAEIEEFKKRIIDQKCVLEEAEGEYADI